MENSIVINQVLAGTVSRGTQGETDGFLRFAGRVDPKTAVDPKWLRDNLLATGDDHRCCSPKKNMFIQEMSMMASPISPLGMCWSPQAVAAGPPRKTRRS